jgi:hypothetical protein
MCCEVLLQALLFVGILIGLLVNLLFVSLALLAVLYLIVSTYETLRERWLLWLWR